MSARGKVILGLFVIAGLCFAMMSTGIVGAQQGKGPNLQQNPPKDGTDSARTKAVQDLELANKLINFGRQQKHAESLLVAAQILHKTPCEQLKIETVRTGGDKSASAPFAGYDAKSLVAEARKMSSAPHCEAMAVATDKMLQESTRGAVGGPKKDLFTIRPGETITWKPTEFRGNEKAVVDIEIFVPGVMTLEVMDQNNNVVVRDNVPGHFYNCKWYPAWTGPFTIRLTNHDKISFNCDLITN